MAACSTAAKKYGYVSDYNDTLESVDGNKPDMAYPDELANLIRLFSDLKSDNVSQQVMDTYSQTLYFNDTLHTFTDRDKLAEYLIDGAQRVDDISIAFHDVAITGENYYVRWIMRMQFRVLRKSVDSQSIGISHIRFDEAGKINFHQDFWDNTAGFFEHLPFVGGMISRIKASMK